MLTAILLLVLSAGLCFGTQEATPLQVHHELDVRLLPTENRLIARDSITCQAEGVSTLTFLLAENASVQSVSIDGRQDRFDFAGGVITLTLSEPTPKSDFSVAMEYNAVFDDPTPRLPVNTEDPGYGVIGTISAEGTFLLPEAGWYPHVPGSRATFHVRVEAPRGVTAVTAGQSLGHLTKDGKTVSSWEIHHPIEGIALSAGRYIVAERTVGRVKAATYFLAPSSHLSGGYLTAVADYLGLYEGLFGPYPFDKFAVVENFFPTGYGFPSYTLLGSSVLRLPFIVRTSLAHEVAHCWWGNGVCVDASLGNWSEALTTYVSDYLLKERESAEEALHYRRQVLRDYATLVRPDEDIPLTAFRQRYSPASRTIGYGKGTMVFHMLRQLVGDEAFWEGLRRVYREKLFQPASWSEFQSAFEQTGNRSLQGFFDQWLSRKGAPLVSMTEVALEQGPGSWKVSGLLGQERPCYLLPLELVLENRTGTIERTFMLSGKEQPFEIICHSMPKSLSVDPGCNVFRRLYPSEIPPTVNSVKASDALSVLIARDSPPELLAAIETLLGSLGLTNYQLFAEGKISEAELTGKDVLVVGYPAQQELLSTLPTTVAIAERGFRIDTKTYNRPEDVFFGVLAHPHGGGRVLAIFLPLSPKAAQNVAGKITHYGRYSYLAFRQGRNLQKGIWPVTESPLIQTWKQERIQPGLFESRDADDITALPGAGNIPAWREKPTQ